LHDYTSKRCKLSIPSLSPNNHYLVYTDSIKYLPVVLYNNFSDDRYINRQSRCLCASSNTILHKYAYCTQRVKLHILESYYLNFICSALWCDYSMSSKSKLRIAFDNVFRNLLGYGRLDSTSSKFAINVTATYEARIRKTYFIFRQWLLSSKNNIVTCIKINTWLRHNYMWREWNNSVYIFHNY